MQNPPYPFDRTPLDASQLMRMLGLTQNLKHENTRICAVNNLQDAGGDDLVYFNHIAYRNYLADCKARFCLIEPSVAKKLSEKEQAGMNFMFCSHPKFYWARAAHLLFPTYPAIGRHQAHAVIGKNVEMGKNAFVDDNSVIGKNSVIGANVTIRNSFIGKNCVIDDNVVLHHCRIGDACIISSGAVIGTQGFGIVPAFADNSPINIPQLGIVTIGSDCLVGANSTIDRATIGMTQIGTHNKIDNLVQIGHNVVIGDYCLIASSCAIAGSCKIGHNVVMGGLCGISDNVMIADGVEIGGGSMIYKDVCEKKQRIWGSPARRLSQQVRLNVLLSKWLQKS